MAVSKKGRKNRSRQEMLITFRGKTQTLVQWGEETGINWKLIHARIHISKWTVDKALTLPADKANKNKSKLTMLTINGESKSLTEWADVANCSRLRIWQRLRRGCSPEDAVFGETDSRGRKPSRVKEWKPPPIIPEVEIDPGPLPFGIAN